MNRQEKLKEIIEKINYCSKMISCEPCLYAKQHWISKASNKIAEALNILKLIESHEEYKFNTRKEFTLEELAQYDGSMGKPAYAAVNGIVYDVSWNDKWSGGTHFGVFAGKDLSAEFKENHKTNVELLKKLPVIGTLKEY